MNNIASCTRAVRAGIETDHQHGAVVPPLHLSTNYSFAGFNAKREYDYSRSGNPTRDLLADALAELERGAGAVVTASGMAAVALALELVPAGGKVLAAHDCYGGTWRLLDAWAKKGRFEVRFVDLTDPTALASVLAEKPSLVWVETPSNPLLRITDIRHVAQAAHAAGALCVVDNTFLSPALQQPLTLGADVVVHSTTKYINGHSDVVGGAVIARESDVAEKLKWWGNCLGLTGAPFDSWLTLRGLRTLSARLRAHQENAAALGDLLDQRIKALVFDRAEIEAELFLAVPIGLDARVNLFRVVTFGLDNVGARLPAVVLRGLFGLAILPRIHPFPFRRNPLHRSKCRFVHAIESGRSW